MRKVVHFIGTSHIAEESVKEIESFIEKEKPSIIAVELDKQRLKALLSNKRDRISLKNIGLVKKIGFTGFVFAYIASFVQKKLGGMVKTQAGSDMLTAINLAKKHKLRVALIDQDVDKTLYTLSKEMTFREKMRLIGDVIKGLFTGEKEAEEWGIKGMDFKKVPQDKVVDKVIRKTKERYPSFYKTLVEDRNRFMIKKLVQLMARNPGEKILAVIGAGHKKEMEELLEEKIEKLKSGKIEVVYGHSVDVG